MPRGYVISRVDMANPDAYARHAAAATKAIADHGGKPLACGGRSEALEGKARARNVVLEFENYDAARVARRRRKSKWRRSREFDSC